MGSRPAESCFERGGGRPCQLRRPGGFVDGAGRVDRDPREAVGFGPGDLACRDRRARSRGDDHARRRRRAVPSRFRGNESGRAPIGDQRVLDALRADGEQRSVARLPHQLPADPERLVVDHVEADDPGAARALLGEPVLRPARLHGDEIDQPDRQAGLAREVDAEVGLVHRRHRMAAHGRVAVEAEGSARHRGEQVAESLVAVDRRRRSDQRHKRAAEYRQAQLDRLADRARLGRRIEGRADLVLRHRRAEGGECPKDRRQLALHPGRALRARDAGDADRPCFGETGKPARGRHVEKEHGLEAGEGEHLHDRRRSREIVAIPGDEATGRQRCRIAGHEPRPPATARDAAVGAPAVAASQASRRAATPAAGPLG